MNYVGGVLLCVVLLVGSDVCVCGLIWCVVYCWIYVVWYLCYLS